MTEPTDPISELREAAVSLHELFLEYKAAGFTDTQALYLVAHILSASIGGSST